jgi:anaerobic selenocysteine-containing dehydrogenase
MISRKVIEPQGESRHEIWVMQELAKRMNLQEQWLYEQPWNAVEKALDGALKTGSFQDLLEGKTLHLRFRPKTEYQTPSGRVEFYSSVAEARGFCALPVQIPLDVHKDDFVLLNSATTNYSHTQFQEVYGPIPTVVHVNPNDAERHGIKKGDVVRLYNEKGDLHLNAIVTDSVPTGVVWCPSLGVDLRGEPQNTITCDVPQSLGGGSTYNSTHVRIERK